MIFRLHFQCPGLFQIDTKDRSDGDYKVRTVRDEESDKECGAISFPEKKGGGEFVLTP